MIARIPVPLLWWALLLLCLPAAWMLGQYQAEQRYAMMEDSRQAVVLNEQARLQARVDQLQAQNNDQRLSLQIAEQRAAGLQEQLDQNIELSFEERAELALYRRIADGKGVQDMLVDSVQLVDDQLSITLLQARGRDRVTGHVAVSVLGQKDGRTVRWILSDADSGDLVLSTAPILASASVQSGTSSVLDEQLLESAVRDEMVNVVSYDLRFFQTLLVNASGITTFQARDIEIWVFPDAEREPAVVKRFRWSDIADGDDQ